MRKSHFPLNLAGFRLGDAAIAATNRFAGAMQNRDTLIFQFDSPAQRFNYAIK